MAEFMAALGRPRRSGGSGSTGEGGWAGEQRGMGQKSQSAGGKTRRFPALSDRGAPGEGLGGSNHSKSRGPGELGRLLLMEASSQAKVTGQGFRKGNFWLPDPFSPPHPECG